MHINQAGGVDCWSDCIAEIRQFARLGVRQTADANATGPWVPLASLQEQAFVNPTFGMVSPAARLAPLTASAHNKTVVDILAAEQQAKRKQKAARGELSDEKQPSVEKSSKGIRQRAKQRNSAARTGGEQLAGTTENSNNSRRTVMDFLPSCLTCICCHRSNRE